jgi:hypothetical protein
MHFAIIVPGNLLCGIRYFTRYADKKQGEPPVFIGIGINHAAVSIPPAAAPDRIAFCHYDSQLTQNGQTGRTISRRVKIHKSG